jgi:hypothetical protein
MHLSEEGTWIRLETTQVPLTINCTFKIQPEPLGKAVHPFPMELIVDDCGLMNFIFVSQQSALTYHPAQTPGWAVRMMIG